jgi:hypothetical protein
MNYDVPCWSLADRDSDTYGARLLIDGAFSRSRSAGLTFGHGHTTSKLNPQDAHAHAVPKEAGS